MKARFKESGICSATIIAFLSKPSKRFDPSPNSFTTNARSEVGDVPTSMTVAPGLTMSGVTNPGRPIADTSRSASRVTAARSFVREWQIVTVAC